MSNFLFLKQKNKDLFNIISEAEKLFRDEYFEQSIVQVRRFAENLCRNILGEKANPDDSFDIMINKIKDNSFENVRMQEFADDLFFIKKQGNISAHSSSSSKNGETALECLERAYEISIFYNNIKYGYDKELDKSVFSEELLMCGKTSSKQLKEKYKTTLDEHRKSEKTQRPQKKNIRTKKEKVFRRDKTELKSKIFNFSVTIGLIALLIAYLYENIFKHFK